MRTASSICRQAMQGLGPKYQVHERRSFTDGITFLAGHTAAHANHQVRLFLLPVLPAAQQGKYLFLGFFADGAGIQQQYIRCFG